MYAISVDTGGTFTDVVVADEGGQLTIGKALTSRDRAFEAISEALNDIAQQLGLPLEGLLARAARLTFGTTRATNAIIEGRTARTAFFTTEGFPDILLLREGGKPDPFRSIPYGAPYVPRHLTFEIHERMDAEGAPFLPLDEASVTTAIEEARHAGCEAIGVCLLWSVANPEHELRVGELIDKHAPGLTYTLSHQINPVVREYRRASAAVIDASLKPVMQEFITGLERDLHRAGFRGRLLISTAYGGSWRPRDVIQHPIYSVGSGPSMAPVAALAYASTEESAAEGPLDLLVCDTGGTTFDVGLVREGKIQHTNETWIGGRWVGHITGIRAVDVKSIGAGGGSVAWVDSGGLVRVGPRSAGSVPGPACYGRGGTEPTVTDAALLLGYLDPVGFLGGRLPLDVTESRRAFESFASALHLPVEEAAQAALTIAGENIVSAIRETTVAQGFDPREVTIVAGGGASGINIVHIAEELGCGKVLLPKTASALSACGALHADIISEFSVSRYVETRDFDLNVANEALAEAERDADEFLADLADMPMVETRKRFLVEARYRQQVWELTVPLHAPRFTGAEDVQRLEETFHDVHQRVFAVSEPGQYLECLAWTVRAVAVLPEPTLALAGAGASNAQPEATSVAPAYFPELGWVDTPRFDGDRLPVDAIAVGPAVIRQPTTTLVIHPGSRVTVTKLGNYLVETRT
ncbi:MAG: hydantoinase/oxoprolinase family protein [Nocardioidaceae bacterium]